VLPVTVPNVLNQLSVFVFKDQGVKEYEPEDPFVMDSLQMKAQHSSAILGDTNPKTPCHILEDLNPHIHCCRNFQMSCTVVKED
jgi:hypothetical protein